MSDTIESLRAQLEQLKAENERLRDTWISVEDRLPFNIIEAGGKHVTQTVICATRFGDVFPFEFSGGVIPKPWYKFDEYEANGGYITHWQPLPEPPKDTDNDV